MAGVFELKTARDLFEKLKLDHAALEASPLDSCRAFNFVVTAWHLREWRFRAPEDRAEVCRRHPILRVCEHLAVGAKHFEPSSSRHDSVADSGRGGAWASGVWAPGVWAEGVWAEWLSIELDGDARDRFGDSLNVLKFAALVMDAWNAEFGSQQSAS